ncbi:rubrerythrin family protein [Streptomyces griseus]|uniref:rubrerythrin family protein n=1 Tax=Streptomyces griseus TaxID=1911 RepID=UPI000A5A3465|nr:rubrerythrin family protein [Streptomyces griseus]
MSTFTRLIRCAGATLALTGMSMSVSQAAVAQALALSTVQDTRAAMRGEGFAHASYLFFADQADREGRRSTAELFRRVAGVELNDHFTQEAALINFVGSDEANLRHAIEGERYEASSMYPTYAEEARQDGDFEAAERFTEIAADEDEHRRLLTQALRALTLGKGTVPAPPPVDRVEVPAGPPQVASARTRANLEDAMHGEGEANAAYTLFARHAERTGQERLAELFHGLADVELHEHFAAEARLDGLVSDTDTNLRTSIAGETYESEVMYPTFARRAEKAGDTRAAALFTEIADDEGDHAAAFRRALGESRTGEAPARNSAS